MAILRSPVPVRTLSIIRKSDFDGVYTMKETTAQLTAPRTAPRKNDVKRSARKASGVSELLIEASKSDVQGALDLMNTNLRGLTYDQVQERRDLELGVMLLAHATRHGYLPTNPARLMRRRV